MNVIKTAFEGKLAEIEALYEKGDNGDNEASDAGDACLAEVFGLLATVTSRVADIVGTTDETAAENLASMAEEFEAYQNDIGSEDAGDDKDEDEG